MPFPAYELSEFTGLAGADVDTKLLKLQVNNALTTGVMDNAVISDVSPITYKLLFLTAPTGPEEAIVTTAVQAHTGFVESGTRLKRRVAAFPPSITDDSNFGFEVGQGWFDTTNFQIYVLVDATPGAAFWVPVDAGFAAYRSTDLVLTSTPESLELDVERTSHNVFVYAWATLSKVTVQKNGRYQVLASSTFAFVSGGGENECILGVEFNGVLAVVDQQGCSIRSNNETQSVTVNTVGTLLAGQTIDVLAARISGTGTIETVLGASISIRKIG